VGPREHKKMQTATLAAVPLFAAALAIQTDPWQPARRRMIDDQIRGRGVTNQAVLDAMRKVPRHLFVPPNLRDAAYDDGPLPIGQGQTISQPYIVAYMTEALGIRPGEHVLEIGTGSGYQAAVLAEIAREVYTIEIVPELADRARETLGGLGYKNVYVRTGNGYAGWPEKAPFPRIMVTAAPDEVPPALVEQLAPGGAMVLPVGTSFQEMTIVTKTAQGIARKTTIPVRFVPMVGKPKR
jgi:protein-L-isoaspartate(D-aspartate) O-methyltransferase